MLGDGTVPVSWRLTVPAAQCQGPTLKCNREDCVDSANVQSCTLTMVSDIEVQLSVVAFVAASCLYGGALLATGGCRNREGAQPVHRSS